MTSQELKDRIFLMYNTYCIEALGQDVEPVSFEQFKQDFVLELSKRLVN